MSTPTLSTFLTGISSLVAQKDSEKVASFLVIEPVFSQIYQDLIRELRRAHPKGSPDDALEAKVSTQLVDLKDSDGVGSLWAAFVKFMTVYLGFLRDVDSNNLLATYELLSDLLQKANSALTHPTYGVVILTTVVNLSKVLSRLAIGLDKQPHLIQHLIPKSASGDDGGPRETLPERAANILRQAFVTCLNDRSGSSPTGLDRSGKPEGKKRGIYTIANLCLKILFACQKLRGCAQIIENIYNQSPRLSAYPKSERVTYLYYLGRFWWGNGHAYRAQKALQEAWSQCHPQALSQRRLILIFLIASNMVCGRFPSAQLFALPEAADLDRKFGPLCQYISQGDLCNFRRHLDVGSEHYNWFAQYRLDLQLRNRCEVFVWRSLIRKAYLLTGTLGVSEKSAPVLDCNNVVTLFRWQENLYLAHLGVDQKVTQSSLPFQPAPYVDPDFVGIEGLASPSLYEHSYSDSNSNGDDNPLVLPDITSVMSKMSALIHQGFLGGYLTFKWRKFAIQGAKRKGGPLQAGFPNMWEAVVKRCEGNGDVPGWKKDEEKSSGGSAAAKGGFGPGMVVKLSGARPAGSNPFGG